jgi:hypothetical protein
MVVRPFTQAQVLQPSYQEAQFVGHFAAIACGVQSRTKAAETNKNASTFFMEVTSWVSESKKE